MTAKCLACMVSQERKKGLFESNRYQIQFINFHLVQAFAVLYSIFYYVVAYFASLISSLHQDRSNSDIIMTHLWNADFFFYDRLDVQIGFCVGTGLGHLTAACSKKGANHAGRRSEEVM